MQTRLWLAGTATLALVAAATFVASPIVYGQAPQSPGADAVADQAAMSRDISKAVQDALDQSGLRDGRFAADIRQAVEEASRSAQDAVRDLDVEVTVDDQLQDFPEVAMLGGRPRIGVRTRDVTAEEAKSAGLAGITGAYVSEAPADSAAGKAGLQEKDIIVSVDGEIIRSARQLARVVGESPEGRALQVGYVRGTAKNSVTVTPQVRSMTRQREPGPAGRDGEGPIVRRFERRAAPGWPDGSRRQFDMFIPRGPGPDNDFFFRDAPGSQSRMWTRRGRLGVVAQPVTDQLATYFGVKEGVLVTQVTDGSAAAKAGIKAGDVITSVNGKPVKDTGDILDHLQGVDDGKALPVEVMRDRKTQALTVTLQAPSDTSRDRSIPRKPRFTA